MSGVWSGRGVGGVYMGEKKKQKKKAGDMQNSTEQLHS